MNINPEISLYTKALTATAIHLWYHKDLINLTKKCTETDYKKIKESISKDIKTLPIPKNNKRDVWGVIDSVGMNIRSYLKSIASLNVPTVDLYGVICWNSLGMIDCEKTGYKMLSVETSNMRKRFMLACFHGFEEEIIKIWSHLKDNLNSHLLSVDEYLRFTYCCSWIEFLKGNSDYKLFYVNCFRFAVNCGQYETAKRFYSSVDFSETYVAVKGSVIKVVCARTHLNPRLLAFLVSKLKKKHQKDLIKYFAKEILHLIIQFPVLEHFVQVNSKNCRLSNIDFEDIINFLSKKMENNTCPPTLFQEFWESSETSQKEYIVTRLLYGTFIEELFENINGEDIYKDFCEQNLKKTLFRNGMAVMELQNIFGTVNNSNKVHVFKNFLEKHFNQKVVLKFFKL